MPGRGLAIALAAALGCATAPPPRPPALVGRTKQFAPLAIRDDAKLPGQAIKPPKLQVEPTQVNLGLLRVGESPTFDLHLAYQFRDGWLGSDRLDVTVINIADTNPPFYLGVTGYDSWVASPLGRVIKVAVTATL